MTINKYGLTAQGEALSKCDPTAYLGYQATIQLGKAKYVSKGDA